MVSNIDSTSARKIKSKNTLQLFVHSTRLKIELISNFLLPIFPPRLHGVMKAHKPEKCYSMRTAVSTTGTPPYGISQYLVELI